MWRCLLGQQRYKMAKFSVCLSRTRWSYIEDVKVMLEAQFSSAVVEYERSVSRSDSFTPRLRGSNASWVEAGWDGGGGGGADQTAVTLLTEPLWLVVNCLWNCRKLSERVNFKLQTVPAGSSQIQNYFSLPSNDFERRSEGPLNPEVGTKLACKSFLLFCELHINFITLTVFSYILSLSRCR
jgi:hypothetical protein